MKTWSIIAALVGMFAAEVQAMTPPPKRIENAIHSGRNFLIDRVLNERYLLNCQSNLQSAPCRANSMGEILSGFFIFEALRVGQKIPENVSSKITARLEKEKQGTSENYFWGYSHSAPADADDTCFGLRTLLLLGNKIQINGLNQFYVPTENAYATFTYQNTPKVELKSASINNRAIHPEVNANIFQMFQEMHLESKVNYDLIKQYQSADGYWFTYFYPGKYYSTYMNMRVLCAANTGSKEVSKGLQFISSSQHADGSWGTPGNTYETALALNTLMTCHAKKNPATRKGITYLLQTQQSDGYWKNEQKIWVYTASDIPEIIWSAYDVNHVLTTALAVQALSNYQTAKE